tara:strand:+ start:917 stop:1213 length:297 start_codon:yes stop_codon:yes gene_type:complete
MGKVNKLANTPLDRDYFKKKENPNYGKAPKLTKCCEQDTDHEVLNVNDDEEWEIIEEYVQKHLIEYSSTESITVVACETCGRLLEYKSVLKQDKKNWR